MSQTVPITAELRTLRDGGGWTVTLSGAQVQLFRNGVLQGRGTWKNGALHKLVAAPGWELPWGIGVDVVAALRTVLAQAEKRGKEKEDPTPEAAVRKAVLDAIGALPDLLVMSNPIGTARFETEQGRYRYVDYGLEVGSPDLVAMMPWLCGDVQGAQWIGLELKAPGKAPKPHQEECHRRWRAHGAWVWPAITSAAEAVEAIEQARQMLRRCGLAPCPVALSHLRGGDGGA